MVWQFQIYGLIVSLHVLGFTQNLIIAKVEYLLPKLEESLSGMSPNNFCIELQAEIFIAGEERS